MKENAVKILYYPVWVSKTGRVSLRWGAACDTIPAAKALGKAEVDAGRASIAFVVEFKDGHKTPLPGGTSPGAARTIIQHWESLWDATEPPSA